MLKDLVGLDNGYLKVISYAGMKKNKNTGSRGLWNCQCRCLKMIQITTYQFTSKRPKSCGCYKQKRTGNKYKHDYLIKHGLAKTKNGVKIHPVYRMWKNIKHRCYKASEDRPEFKIYRGKGIDMYPDWRENSKSFTDWVLSNGWKPGLCIDRIDPKKGYYPDNCQFLTMSQNSKKVFTDNPMLGRGIHHRDAKINEDDVREIRKLLLLGFSNRSIAKVKGIKDNVVYQIKSGKTWKNIE